MGIWKKMWEREMQTLAENKAKKEKLKEIARKAEETSKRADAIIAENKAKDKERAEYYKKLDAAKTEAERAEIKREFRKNNPVDVSMYVNIRTGGNEYDLTLNPTEEAMLDIFYQVFRDYDFKVAKRARDYISLERKKGWDIVRFHAGDKAWFSFVPASQDMEALKEKKCNKASQAYWRFEINSPENIRDYSTQLINSAIAQAEFDKDA